MTALQLFEPMVFAEVVPLGCVGTLYRVRMIESLGGAWVSVEQAEALQAEILKLQTSYDEGLEAWRQNNRAHAERIGKLEAMLRLVVAATPADRITTQALELLREGVLPEVGR